MSLVAKVSTQVHLITLKDLVQVMSVYPEMKERVMEQMELSCNLGSNDLVSESRNNYYNQSYTVTAISILSMTLKIGI